MERISKGTFENFLDELNCRSEGTSAEVMWWIFKRIPRWSPFNTSRESMGIFAWETLTIIREGTSGTPGRLLRNLWKYSWKNFWKSPGATPVKTSQKNRQNFWNNFRTNYCGSCRRISLRFLRKTSKGTSEGVSEKDYKGTYTKVADGTFRRIHGGITFERISGGISWSDPGETSRWITGGTSLKNSVKIHGESLNGTLWQILRRTLKRILSETNRGIIMENSRRNFWRIQHFPMELLF